MNAFAGIGLTAACLTAMTTLAERVETFQATTRGFGDVVVTARFFGEGKGETSWTTFEAEDAAHASVCASKRLADLSFGDLKPAADCNLPGTALERPDTGAWLLGIEGNRFHELFAPSRKALARQAKACGAASWQAVTTNAYPRWLDCFDNAGPGVWVGGGGDQYVLPSDFEWLRDRKLTMCTLSPTESRLVGPGVLDTTVFDWHAAMAATYDLLYRVLFFPASHEWLWNRVPLPYVLPGPGRVTVSPWFEYQCNTGANAVEPVPALDPYVGDLRQRLASHLASDPNHVGMHGCTEIPEAGVDLLSAVANTPGVKQLWHAYLATELGMDLATAGQLHKGDPSRYRSWDDVEVPGPLDFIGWNAAACIDLRGAWQMHADTGRVGVAQAWFDPAKAPADWVEGDCNDPMILVYTPQRQREKEKQPDFWMRRALDLPAGRAKTLRFLHIARDVYHGNHTPLFGVWLNGVPLKTRSEERGDLDQCFEVGDALRDGVNQLVLNTHGTPVPGYCFLGETAYRRYPAMTEPENRLWFDAVNFDAWLRVGKIEDHLCATRAADPERPLKMMATIDLLDLTTPLAERYGAYQHDTGGAGGYWCPMSGARLARSHGLPWSCEQGGPPHTAADMQAAMTYYLMYGNDAVDLVFGVGHYRDKPDVSAWFDKNLELIRCIGQMHLPTPRIALLRSSRTTRLGFEEPWNWDIARGALQGVGRNFAYVEVPDILNGTIDQFAVVIDCGTVLLADNEIEGLRRYVQRGGIFVAQHHTGRHSPARADTWALAKAWGLSVTPKHMSEENFNRWPLAKLKFGDDQNLLPSLRGKEIEGSGVAVDSLGREHGGAVSIGGAGKTLRPVATWEDGSMAIAEVQAGRGRFILLGTPFYLRMKDVAGVWANDDRRGAWLDEFLVALGVPRDSWSGNREVWAERWRSKNGVFDLYPVARMTRVGDDSRNVQVALRRETPPSGVVELSALGHPGVKASWKDGQMSLPPADYGLMQARVFAVPRAEIARAALDWFKTQASLWRALAPLPEERKPREVPVPENLLPLPDGWTLKLAGQPDRTVRLGAFGTLGLPEKTTVAFEKSVTVPAGWKGRRIDLMFNAEGWFWGILPEARLWINGQPAAIKQPLQPAASPGFAVNVTDAAATGTLLLRLEIDGIANSALRKDQAGQFKPHGVTGLFYLESTAAPLKTEPLPGPWLAADGFNVLHAVQPGEKVKCLYFETRFTLPAVWPAKRLLLEAPDALGFLVLNGQVLRTPAWMKRLDVSGLVRRDGANVLRWVPASRSVAAWNRAYNGVLPGLNMTWTE